MKHLFLSCAVIALMAAPAVAQSTNNPAQPMVETEQTLDPTTRDEDEMPPEFVPQAEPTTTTEADEADVADETDVADEADEASEAETIAEPAFSAEPSMTTNPAVDRTSDVPADTDPQSDMMTVSDIYSEARNEAMAQSENFEPTITEASLADDYSTDDLNAMMLAQLNVVAVEIADAAAASGSNVYASTQSYAETDAAMTETAEPGEAMTEDYASTQSMSRSLNVAPEAYAAVDPALDREAAQSNGDTETMADVTGETLQMADTSVSTMVTAEGDIDQTAVEIAVSDGRFTTLVELVSLAGLDDELGLEGPYTVFAPTNDAFADLPESTLARLRSDAGREELVGMLTSHVAEGTVMASSVPMTGQTLETIGDVMVTVTGKSDGTLNIDGSNTIGDGIFASNGVVYAIDAVILPEAVPAPEGN